MRFLAPPHQWLLKLTLLKTELWVCALQGPFGVHTGVRVFPFGVRAGALPPPPDSSSFDLRGRAVVTRCITHHVAEAGSSAAPVCVRLLWPFDILLALTFLHICHMYDMCICRCAHPFLLPVIWVVVRP
jgi:hypothetical protein